MDLSKAIGIDLGLKTFAVTHNGSDTKFVERAKYIKDAEKKLASGPSERHCRREQ